MRRCTQEGIAEHGASLAHASFLGSFGMVARLRIPNLTQRVTAVWEKPDCVSAGCWVAPVERLRILQTIAPCERRKKPFGPLMAQNAWLGSIREYRRTPRFDGKDLCRISCPVIKWLAEDRLLTRHGSDRLPTSLPTPQSRDTHGHNVFSKCKRLTFGK